jgi:hypothetical protein
MQPESNKPKSLMVNRWRGHNDVPDAQSIPIIEITPEFLDFVSNRADLEEFASLVRDCFAHAKVSLVSLPREIKFSVFDDPDAGGSSGRLETEPIIRLYYPAGGTKRITELTAGIEDFVKEYLARVSESLDQFKKYRAIQKRFRFVIWRK